jgi:tRNA dimethylallyltransferase
VDELVLPKVPPNTNLRKKLEKKSLVDLQKILARLVPRRFSNIDIKNPVRLIRAIEISTKLGSVPKIKKQDSQYEFLEIGTKLNDKELRQRIHNRLIARIKDGMVKEAINLHKNGLPWRRMNELGLEYRYLSKYLEKKLTKQEFIEKLETEIWRYAKRQITWFKRDKKIKWLSTTETKKIEKEVVRFLI